MSFKESKAPTILSIVYLQYKEHTLQEVNFSKRHNIYKITQSIIVLRYFTTLKHPMEMDMNYVNTDTRTVGNDCFNRWRQAMHCWWLWFFNMRLTILDLLPVTWWFFQSFDNHRRSTWYNRHFGLSVLNGQLDSNPETLPVLGCLGDIISNFLWWLLYHHYLLVLNSTVFL